MTCSNAKDNVFSCNYFFAIASKQLTFFDFTDCDTVPKNNKYSFLKIDCIECWQIALPIRTQNALAQLHLDIKILARMQISSYDSLYD